jgi:hypothetical protein
MEALNLIRSIRLHRRFHGAIILRGEGIPADDSGLVEQYESQTPQAEEVAAEGLLHGMTVAATQELHSQNMGAILRWGDINFSTFAFDLLALLNGTYRPGYASSFHGLEIQDSEST